MLAINVCQGLFMLLGFSILVTGVSIGITRNSYLFWILAGVGLGIFVFSWLGPRTNVSFSPPRWIENEIDGGAAAVVVLDVAPTVAPATQAQAPASTATQLPTIAPVQPAAPAPAAAQPPAQPSSDVVRPAVEPPAPAAPAECKFVSPSGDPNTWPKQVIELAPLNTWFHRVFDTKLFNAAANWGGADSWFVSLALGNNSGGSWASHGNPGEIVYRGTSTQIAWCLGLSTDNKWREQFMGKGVYPLGINVRIAPNSTIAVKTAGGRIVNQSTSDMGDITVILPNSGVVTISVSYATAAPTHESLVWWGPYDRSKNINTIDAR